MARKKRSTKSVKRHILVPKHTKISDAEKKRVLQHYAIDITQLPKIKSTDPALRELEVQEGDVIKIERLSYTAGVSYYYRGVSDE